MGIQISRREVLNNIIRFKDKLLIQKDDRKERKWGKRFYRALLNRHTGDIRFIEESAKFQPSEEWREFHIDVDEDANRLPHFNARDEKNQPIGSLGLDPLAWRIMSETLETLNLIVSRHPSNTPDLLPEEAALEDLSQIHLSEVEENIEEMPGWEGNIDRIEAEKRLKNQSPWTYLLRHAGSMTQLLAKGLSESNRMKVKAYLVTMKDADKKKVDEQVLLYTERGWTIYRDNPDLKDSEYLYYTTCLEALRKLEPRAKTPLKD